jgi:hypothetical protein
LFCHTALPVDSTELQFDESLSFTDDHADEDKLHGQLQQYVGEGKILPLEEKVFPFLQEASLRSSRYFSEFLRRFKLKDFQLVEVNTKTVYYPKSICVPYFAEFDADFHDTIYHDLHRTVRLSDYAGLNTRSVLLLWPSQYMTKKDGTFIRKCQSEKGNDSQLSFADILEADGNSKTTNLFPDDKNTKSSESISMIDKKKKSSLLVNINPFDEDEEDDEDDDSTTTTSKQAHDDHHYGGDAVVIDGGSGGPSCFPIHIDDALLIALADRAEKEMMIKKKNGEISDDTTTPRREVSLQQENINNSIITTAGEKKRVQEEDGGTTCCHQQDPEEERINVALSSTKKKAESDDDQQQQRGGDEGVDGDVVRGKDGEEEENDDHPQLQMQQATINNDVSFSCDDLEDDADDERQQDEVDKQEKPTIEGDAATSCERESGGSCHQDDEKEEGGKVEEELKKKSGEVEGQQSVLTAAQRVTLLSSPSSSSEVQCGSSADESYNSDAAEDSSSTKLYQQFKPSSIERVQEIEICCSYVTNANEHDDPWRKIRYLFKVDDKVVTYPASHEKGITVFVPLQRSGGISPYFSFPKITQFYIRSGPQIRRMGYGLLCMQALLANLLKRGHRQVVIGSPRQSSLGFYRKAGFRMSEENDLYKRLDDSNGSFLNTPLDDFYGGRRMSRAQLATLRADAKVIEEIRPSTDDTNAINNSQDYPSTTTTTQGTFKEFPEYWREVPYLGKGVTSEESSSLSPAELQLKRKDNCFLDEENVTMHFWLVSIDGSYIIKPCERPFKCIRKLETRNYSLFNYCAETSLVSTKGYSPKLFSPPESVCITWNSTYWSCVALKKPKERIHSDTLFFPGALVEISTRKTNKDAKVAYSTCFAYYFLGAERRTISATRHIMHAVVARIKEDVNITSFLSKQRKSSSTLINIKENLSFMILKPNLADVKLRHKMRSCSIQELSLLHELSNIAAAPATTTVTPTSTSTTTSLAGGTIFTTIVFLHIPPNICYCIHLMLPLLYARSTSSAGGGPTYYNKKKAPQQKKKCTPPPRKKESELSLSSSSCEEVLRSSPKRRTTKQKSDEVEVLSAPPREQRRFTRRSKDIIPTPDAAPSAAAVATRKKVTLQQEVMIPTPSTAAVQPPVIGDVAAEENNKLLREQLQQIQHQLKMIEEKQQQQQQQQQLLYCPGDGSSASIPSTSRKSTPASSNKKKKRPSSLCEGRRTTTTTCGTDASSSTGSSERSRRRRQQRQRRRSSTDNPPSSAPVRYYEEHRRHDDDPHRRYDDDTHRRYHGDPHHRRYDDPHRGYDDPHRRYDDPHRRYDDPHRGYDDPHRRYDDDTHRRYDDPHHRRYDDDPHRRYDDDPHHRRYDDTHRRCDDAHRSSRYDDQRSRYDDHRSRCDDQRSRCDDTHRRCDDAHRSSRYDDQRSRYDDHRSRCDDQRSRCDDQGSKNAGRGGLFPVVMGYALAKGYL